MKVAVIQTRTPATARNGLKHVVPLIREAAEKGATLILTPEGTNFLQRDRGLLGMELRPAKEDVCVQGLIDLASELGVWIVIGSGLVRGEGGAAANRQFVIDPTGAIVATYDKMHMFDVDLPTGETARESALYAPGDKAVLVDVAGAKVGLTICYDIRFPALYRALAVGGAQILTMAAAFTRPTGEAHWSVLLRARAIETGSFVLAAAQGGYHEDGRGTYGRSMIVDPWGRVLGKLDHDEPGVLVAEIDLAGVAAARNAIPALRNARAFTGPAA
jgi:predicted amidohydrolase